MGISLQFARSFQNLLPLVVICAVSLQFVPLASLSPAEAATINFVRKTILTPSLPGAGLFENPTTLAFGPDGLLYVGQQNGLIHVLTLDAGYNVTNVDVIYTVYNTPNYNDDKSPAPDVQGRTLLGIVFDPDSPLSAPVMYVTHSDPRIGYNNSQEALAIDTHSGMLTRLTGPHYDDPGQRVDLITDLPRSRENHGPNGLDWGPDGWLYFAQGGNTNNGAPSYFFSNLPERYLTAAVLRANVKDPAFAPFSAYGIDGPGDILTGTFEIYATGYRNAYDIVWHSNGKLYANDNGGNDGLGPVPGPEDGCPSTYRLSPPNQSDRLYVVNQGDYGGHPNPARGECVFTDGTIYDPDVPPLPNYHAHIDVYDWGNSTDGIAEYTANTFAGAMLGNLICATWGGDQSLRRVVLNDGGDAVTAIHSLGYFDQALDVTTDDDGVIYVAEHGGDRVTLLIPSEPGTTGVWYSRSSLPHPVAEVSSVVELDGKIYVPGGLTTGFDRFPGMQVYDPTTDSWAVTSNYPAPNPLDHMGAAAVDGYIYLSGGLENYPTPAVATTFAYSPSVDLWEEKAPMPLPRAAMGVTVIDGKIYAAGGVRDGYAVDDLTVYYPVTDTWANLASMPTARDHHVVEAVNGKLYAIGGRDSGVHVFTSTMTTTEIYDPAANAWSTGASMPTARAGMGSGVLNDRIIVYGGEGSSGGDNVVFEETEEYDPATDTWRTLAAMITPRHGNDGAVYNGVLYAPGGGITPGGSFTDTHEAFSFGDICPIGGSADSDGDGYTDQDEVDNGADPCNAASAPSDYDNDLISDSNDPDDDNDGVLDVDDQLFFDPSNGHNTVLPLAWGWNPGDPVRGGVARTGFRGTQITSSGNRYDPQKISTGAAGGFMSILAGEGTNAGGVNTQENALQLGFDATRPFRVKTRVTEPFVGVTPLGAQAGGMFLGLDEDNYVKLVVTADNGSGNPGIQFALETGGVLQEDPTGNNLSIPLPGPGNFDLILEGNPAAQTISAYYRIDSADPANIKWLGTVVVPAGFFVDPLNAGVLATHHGTSQTITFAFDFFEVSHNNVVPMTLYRINSGGAQAITTTSGVVWEEDGYFTASFAGPADPPRDIAGTVDDAIYLSERYASEDLGTFSYNLPVPEPYTYTVRLHFAETYWQDPGQRVFSVNLEGGAVELENYDIVADVGPNMAIFRAFEVPVADGALDVDFSASVDRPKISGIEVVKLETQADPALEVVKGPDQQTVLRGSPATFTIGITNSGDVTMEDLSVTDGQVPNCDRLALGNLVAGASLAYTCGVPAAVDDFVNTVVVTATSQLGGTVVGSDAALVEVTAPAAVTVSKEPESRTIRSGSTVTFTIYVTNTGGITLTEVAVLDAPQPLCNRDHADLAPLQGFSYDCVIPVVTQGFTNSVIVTGTPPFGDPLVATDTAWVYIEDVYYLPRIVKNSPD